MKKTFKLFSLILLSIVLFSCGDDYPMDINLNRPYVVKAIKTYNISAIETFGGFENGAWILINQSYNKTHCRYVLKREVWVRNFNDRMIIVDSIGKFNVGDTVQLSAYKIIKNKR
jgi:hypothetical protein